MRPPDHDRQGNALAVSEPPVAGPQNRPAKGISRRRALLLLAGLGTAGGIGAAFVATRESGTDAPTLGADPAMPAPDPAPAPAEQRPPSVAAQPQDYPPLPYPAVSMWINTFEYPPIRDMPADVLDTLNLVIIAMAHSAEGGTGRLSWQPINQSPEEVTADIAGRVSMGTPVLLGIGGSNDGGITVTNDQQVVEFCDSIRELVQTYGFTGIDIDLEPSGSSWEQSALVAVVRTLKQEYGTGFIVGLTVGLYGEHSARWLALARELDTDMDYWSPMLYDYEEAHDERLVADALKKTQLAVDGGVPASKHILGFMCNSYYNTSPVPVTGAVWEAVREKHPDVLGAFIWESSLEYEHDYEWTRQVGADIAALG